MSGDGQMSPEHPVIRDAAQRLLSIPSDEWLSGAVLMRKWAADRELPADYRQLAGRLAMVLEAMARGLDPLEAFALLYLSGGGRN